MNDNSTNTELLIQYLDGELTGPELEALQAQLAVNTAMQQELENLRVSRLVIQIHGLKQKVTSLHTEMMQELHEEPATKTGLVRRLWKPWLRIAAVLILVPGLWILYQYMQLSSRTLFNDQYQAFTLHENRGNSNTSTIDSLYFAGEYNKVLQSFNQLHQPTATDCFITGNAAMRLNKPDTAITCFQLARQQNQQNHSHFFDDDLQYYLAMAYLQNDQPQQALPLFEKINADKSHPYNRRVSSWFLQKLHWLTSKK